MLPSFDEFLRESLTNGFDEVWERAWPANAVVETHSHPFAVNALVVQGEMWLTVAGDTRHLVPGDAFALALDQAHAERYGESGATYWVARRN
jgi:hypothetical protein